MKPSCKCLMKGKLTSRLLCPLQLMVLLLSYHCIIHQSVLCASLGKEYSDVMETTMKLVNFLRASSALQHRLLRAFLTEVSINLGCHLCFVVLCFRQCRGWYIVRLRPLSGDYTQRKNAASEPKYLIFQINLFYLQSRHKKLNSLACRKMWLWGKCTVMLLPFGLKWSQQQIIPTSRKQPSLSSPCSVPHIGVSLHSQQ